MAGFNRNKRKNSGRKYVTQRYTPRTVEKDREYGFFWYSWIWNLLRPLLVLLCSLLIVVGIFSTGWRYFDSHYLAATDATDTSTPGFVVDSGASITSIGKKLEKEDYIKSSNMFKYYVQFSGLTGSIQSGTYYISRSMSLNDVVRQLTSGNVTNERTIRIIPGWTCEDIADYLVAQGALTSRDEFLAVCKKPDAFYAMSDALTVAHESPTFANRIYALEGYLAPDTYRIYLDASAESIVKTLLTQADVVNDSLFSDDGTLPASDESSATAEPQYDENGNLIEPTAAPTAQPVAGVSLSQDEIYTLASIIQREAGNAADMARVSAVFYNRLTQGMKLESDPTATYLTDTTRVALTSEDISVDTQYNTYVISGLPVGPICNPSKAALTAALNPDQTYIEQGYLYFCSKDPASGELDFSVTYEEHAAKVATYRPLWEAYDAEKAAATPAPTDTAKPAA